MSKIVCTIRVLNHIAYCNMGIKIKRLKKYWHQTDLVKATSLLNFCVECKYIDIIHMYYKNMAIEVWNETEVKQTPGRDIFEE